MPCHDHRDTPDYVRAEANAEAKQHADYLARMLCAATRQLLAAGLTPENEELQAWWKEHEAFDRKREAFSGLSGIELADIIGSDLQSRGIPLTGITVGVGKDRYEIELEMQDGTKRRVVRPTKYFDRPREFWLHDIWREVQR